MPRKSTSKRQKQSAKKEPESDSESGIYDVERIVAKKVAPNVLISNIFPQITHLVG